MHRSSEDPVALRLIERLYATVGAFFCNTRRTAPRIRPVCTGPAAEERSLCSQCSDARAKHGDSLADLVVPLAYAKGRMPTIHQSAHHVRAYKAPSPAPGCAKDLQLMAGAATYLHGPCIAAVTAPWDAVTFIPSDKRPDATHPIAGIARQVHNIKPSTAKVGLAVGPGFDTAPSRVPRSDRFEVPEEYMPSILGRHVLVVDDTWVSGNKAQSAALALRVAGASRVTILCVARWLRYDWPDHRELIESLVEPYDAAMCPVTGGRCP